MLQGVQESARRFNKFAISFLFRLQLTFPTLRLLGQIIISSLALHFVNSFLLSISNKIFIFILSQISDKRSSTLYIYSPIVHLLIHCIFSKFTLEIRRCLKFNEILPIFQEIHRELKFSIPINQSANFRQTIV